MALLVSGLSSLRKAIRPAHSSLPFIPIPFTHSTAHLPCSMQLQWVCDAEQGQEGPTQKGEPALEPLPALRCRLLQPQRAQGPARVARTGNINLASPCRRRMLCSSTGSACWQVHACSARSPVRESQHVAAVQGELARQVRCVAGQALRRA